MDFDTYLKATDSIQKLKCSTCNNLLSYFPIFISADKDNICGRCGRVDNPHRNEAFETLAQFIKFPCRFEGCEEKFLPKDTPEHEKNCPYRLIKCPLVKSITRCDWKGSFSTVLEHCETQHRELFLDENEFEVDLTCSHKSQNLLVLNNTLFVFTRGFHCGTVTFKYSIIHVEHKSNLQNPTCQITLKSGTSKRVILEECKSTSFDQREIVEIPLDILKLDNNKVVYGKISLVGSKLDIEEKMLSLIKCSSWRCSAYALPPIYHDKNGHITCSECMGAIESKFSRNDNLDKPPIYHDEDDNCSECTDLAPESEFSINYNLCNIATSLNYPCKYRGNGCSLILKSEQMKQHQKFCCYRNYDCPVNEYVACKWYGSGTNLSKHLQESHQDMIRDNYSRISVTYSYCILTKCYLIKFNNHFFKVIFSIDEDKLEDIIKVKRHYKWVAQMIGPNEDDFMYDVEILDFHNHGKKLTSRQLCQSLTTHDDLFTNEEKYCSFSFKQIRSLICPDFFTFKISILKSEV